MSRPPKAVDYDLTAMLGLDELEVVKYEDGQYTAMNADHELPKCIYCGGDTRNHDTRTRNFYDCIKDEEGKPQFIYLAYDQYMYQCLNTDCHSLFPRKIDFARGNAKLTKRLEEMIVHYGMFLSYGDIKNKFEDKISRTTVKDTISNWTNRHDEDRGAFYTPEILCIISFETTKVNYILVADGVDENKCIIDVLLDIGSGQVMSILSRFDKSKIKRVVVDVNPTIVEVIRDQLPGVEIQVHTGALLLCAKKEFELLINNEGPHLYKVDRKSLLKSPQELAILEGSSDEVKRYNDEITYENNRISHIIGTKPRIGVAYEHIINLYKVLSPDSDYSNLKKWEDAVSIVCPEDFELTIAYVEHYMQELLNFYLRRTEVTKDIYDELVILNNLIDEFKTYSADVLRAKILYQVEPLLEEVDGKTLWRGVPLEKVIAITKKLLNEWRRKK